ncbi:hypothetical protein QBC42DRAFT_337197 [Cladorrhinum samala]|uniref:C3H1-type domain-containing protein n=1 Tax=Cladorrhinum samala TaxID=585594 RepID=A0AAV9HXA5_9PEZI|nr:hypothetical protein QBC42DRAFT_337197 [Cladorrhinum samala]
MSNRYNLYDGHGEPADSADPYVAVFNHWESSVVQLRAIENRVADSYKDLIRKYQEKVAECEREKRNAMLWEKEQRMAERELNGLKAAAESSPFAFVVIDGDGAVFREDLIAQGEEGGIKAAHELNTQLKAYFSDQPSFCNIDTIIIHVVLSVEGLSRALNASGTLPVTDHAALAKFGRGFCRAQPLFSFTDVGYGKEQADHKVRKLFEIMERNIQCRCLILGGCHDNGYATFLESFRNNSKICLLETTPPAADFRKLNSFKRINLPELFRSEPIPSSRTNGGATAPPPGFASSTAFSTTPPGFAALAPSVAPPPPPPTTGAPPPALISFTSPVAASSPKTKQSTAQTKSDNSYASLGRQSSGVTINIASQKSQKKAAANRPFMQLNKDDQRVDVPLPKPDAKAVTAIEERRKANGSNFCNRYHLGNSCKNGSDCQFHHGERLTGAELMALKHKTRNLVCSNGHYCRDISCNLGHHCSNPGSCYFGNTCRFSELHGMDIVSTYLTYPLISRCSYHQDL